jgi:hypothetical protein
MADAAEETQFELDISEAQETEVEIEGSKTEPASIEVEQSSSEDAEMDQYSDSVRKRINRLTKKMRDAEREREEALRYAQNVQQESTQIRQRMHNLDQGYMSEYGNRLALQQQQAENDLKRAVELGDAEGTVKAQKALTDVSVSFNNYSAAQRQAAYNNQQQPVQQQPVQQQPVQQAPPVRPDAKAEEWAGRNTWFGQDEAMTFAAFGIHKKLIEEEGFDPKSNDYYNELDVRIKNEFPHKFSGTQSVNRKPAQTVAGVSRSSSSGRNRRVRLSPTQVAIAKKLGVPLEEYAKYVKE